ncbi:MAG: flagellar biosynthesis protein FlhF [Phycisphaerales bacterium]|nr:flagellar biosynthesis protein FlhF [Phycisphaerales bacterium]
MQLKTYRGNSMADALAEVKRDLGQDAVILHARTIRVGGVAGFGAKNMYEITASNQETPVKQPRIASRSSGRAAAEGAADSSVAVVTRPPAAVAAATRNAAVTEVDSFQPIEYGTRRPVEVVAPERKTETTSEHASSNAPAAAIPAIENKPLTRSHPSPARGLATRVELRPTTQAAVRSIDEELASIKQLVGQLLQEQRLASARAGVVAPAVGASDPLASAMLKLSERLIAPTLAESLLGEVRDTLEAHELRDENTVQNTLLSRMAARIRMLAGPGPASTKAGPRTIAVVGSTGVGKTTTIAKIAATCKLRQNQRVGLITCDTYRIAAVDQLRTYANIIGLPLKVALTPMEVASARAQLADCDIVFVDTPGRAPTDERRLEELRRFIESSEAGEIHLALSAGSAEGVMRRSASAFSRLRPDRILLTKLDEADTLGPAFNVLCELGLPLGCVTTGQEVPDDIEHANPERFARWVLDLPVFSRA